MKRAILVSTFAFTFNLYRYCEGWRRDAPDPADPERGRLDYCEVVMWPETADRLWWGCTS
jgi:hypothetical protein